MCAVAAALAGCYTPDRETGAILKVGNGAEVQSLDPQLVSGVTEHRVLTSLFEGLADLDPKTMAATPGAAESWTVSEDGKTYTFALRRDGKWSDGAPLTARDFVYSWRRELSPTLAAEYGYLLHCLKNAKPYNEGKLKDFDQVGVKALDDYTLRVELENPTPYFLSMQIHYAWFPVQQATIERFGKMDDRDTTWTRAGNHVGNGAFLLVEWSPNEVIRVEKNPYYWNAAHVRLDGIHFYPIDNELTEERSFRAHELDMTSTVPMHKIPVYKKKYPELLNISPYVGVYFYRLNATRPPFTDKRVRQAFSMAIDREELARNVLKGDEPPAWNFTPPGLLGYTCATHLAYDVARARQLIAEAGYPDGKGMPPVDILYNSSESHRMIAETIQRMWKENLNADVRLLNQDWKVYLNSMDTLDYGVARSAWIADVLDPVNFLECFLTNGGNNRTGWTSPEYDAIIQHAYAEPDSTKRFALLQDAEKMLLDESPIAPIYFYTWKFLKSPEVKGLVPNVLGYLRWTDMWLERGRD
jgi:oligopeptide transport system substrate-binding protein